MSNANIRAPYEIDPGKLNRFDARKNIFGRVVHDRDFKHHYKSLYMNAPEIIARNREGCSHIEIARTMAGWTVYDHFKGAFSPEKLTTPFSDLAEPKVGKLEVKDTSEMTGEVKETARRLGAVKAGVCLLDRRWLYTNDMWGTPVEVPENCSNAIVMAIEMDRKNIESSPRWAAATEGGIGYSRVAMAIACMSQFIRFLGYNAVPTGNNLALCVPLAIDAGLGELGRNGLLVTPEYGPCVRLGAVFTDLPLAPDKPQTLQLMEFCKTCMKCAQACEVNAIKTDTEPSFEIETVSNNPGYRRWAVNHEKCYDFWMENGNGCSTCISSCLSSGVMDYMKKKIDSD